MSNFYVGLDIGGTNVRLAIMDSEHNIVGKVIKKSVDYQKSAKENIEIVINWIRDFIQINKLENSNLKGVGVSLAAIFDRQTGEIVKWPNNQTWNGYPLKGVLEESFQVQVILEDDCNSAALAECYFGNGRGHQNFLYINIGTGIGSGIILNEQCYRGNHGFAGEIGHIRIMAEGPLCKCGHNGCLQAYASGPALIKRANELAAKESLNVDITSIQKICEFASKGEPWAIQVFDEGADYVARVVSQLIMFIDFSLIIFGGGVIQAYPRLLNIIKKRIGFWLLDLGRQIKVSGALLGDNSGVLGALSLIIDHEKRM